MQPTGSLVYLICLICLIYLICLVYLCFRDILSTGLEPKLFYLPPVLAGVFRLKVLESLAKLVLLERRVVSLRGV